MLGYIIRPYGYRKRYVRQCFVSLLVLSLQLSASDPSIGFSILKLCILTDLIMFNTRSLTLADLGDRGHAPLKRQTKLFLLQSKQILGQFGQLFRLCNCKCIKRSNPEGFALSLEPAGLGSALVSRYRLALTTVVPQNSEPGSTPASALTDRRRTTADYFCISYCHQKRLTL